ncbi:hypothetical protein DL93DRAFT_2093069 [Clavulina sp. PMI_390]|nr:hypothetical protein DL93DRAFT_2093069 [Clavulina sp. PMI_390]
MKAPWIIEQDDIDYINTLPANETQAGWDSIISYKNNSFLSPSILSYVILGSFGIATILAAIAPIFSRLSIPLLRPIKRFFFSPTFGKRHARTVTIIPAIKRRGWDASAWISLHVGLRWETLAIAALWIANIVGVTAFYTPSDPEENIYFPGETTYPQLIRYVADRAGVLATAQMVLVYLLAGRNSPIALLTRGYVTFPTLMLFHRWVARIVVVQSFVHAMAYTVDTLYLGGHANWLLAFEPYWNWGVAAMAFLSILWGLSIRKLRHIGYEASLYYHVHLLEYDLYDEYLNYCYTAIAFWTFERACRLLRLFVLNVNLSSSSAPRFSKATLVSTVPNSILDTSPSSEGAPPFVLRIFPVGPAARRASVTNELWAPGQHVYISIPGIQLLGCHPFTVVSSGLVPPPLVAPAPGEHSEDNEKTGGEVSSAPLAEERAYIDLALVPRAGITKSLAKRLGRTDGSEQLTVFVDGPYGHALDLDSYHFFHLAAGGIGSTYMIPFFIDAIRRDTIRLALSRTSPVSDAEAQFERTPVYFVWAMKTVSTAAYALPYFEEVAASLRAANPSFEKKGTALPYTIEMHTTVATASSELESSIQARYDALAPYITVTWSHGRPSLVESVAASQESVTAGTKGKMAVIACGPDGFVDDTRYAATHADANGGVQVDYYEESFSW